MCPILCEFPPPPPSVALPRCQVEYGTWVAADVALFRLVPAESQFDELHSALPGVTAQRSTGCWLPAEAAGDAKVRLELETEITDHT